MSDDNDFRKLCLVYNHLSVQAAVDLYLSFRPPFSVQGVLKSFTCNPDADLEHLNFFSFMPASFKVGIFTILSSFDGIFSSATFFTSTIFSASTIFLSSTNFHSYSVSLIPHIVIFSLEYNTTAPRPCIRSTADGICLTPRRVRSATVAGP